MKNVVLILAILAMAITARALGHSCQAVFSESEVTAEDIAKTIADLASLRYDLDMKKIEGNRTLVWALLAKDYEKKEKALA
jgi:hypothetical protein